MARNQEKAQTMLARWLRYKEEEAKGPKKRRPYLADLCNDLHEAEKWRTSIIKEISRKVSEIQNASLSEQRIRDLNDRINKLFREKSHWEKRIKTLGGIDYTKNKKNKNENTGYRYFGVAKDLPGVKELLVIQKNKANNLTNFKIKDRNTGKIKKTRKQMYDMININYYGLGLINENSDILLEEQKKEKKVRELKIEKWLKENKDKESIWYDMYMDEIKNEENIKKKRMNKNGGNEIDMPKKKKMRFDSKIPTQEEIDKMILEKRKEMLLKKYTKNNDNIENNDNKIDDNDMNMDDLTK